MKKLILLLFFFSSVIMNAQIIGYRDSIFTTCHDTTIKVPIYGVPVVTSIAGVYGNKVSSYLLTEAGQNSEIAWLKKNGFNSYCGYGVSDYLVSNKKEVQNFFLKLRRNGIYDVGVPYSSTSVMAKVENYNKSCPNDSMKINFVRTEIEPYLTKKYNDFYNTLKTVFVWCIKNNIRSEVYYGWLNWPDANGVLQNDHDSIVKYTHRLNLHAYREYSKYAYPGADAYGYTSGRIKLVTASAKKQNKIGYELTIIYSTENPEKYNSEGKLNAQFGYKYYLTHTWKELHEQYIQYYNSGVTNDTKIYIKLIGFVIFVENQAKVIKP